MSEKPRYSRVCDIFEVAVFMQSKPEGITIKDIMERFSISRRTAERMRDSLVMAFPQICETGYKNKQKHWSFKHNAVSNFIKFTPKEIANIEQLGNSSLTKDIKTEIKTVVEKMKSLTFDNYSATQSQIELYLQTEGFAVRQMPDYNIDLNTMDIVREGIRFSKKIEGIYHDKKRLLEPLGLIFGNKTYLIAKEKAKGRKIYNYLLHKLTKVKLTGQTFEKNDFNIQEYSKQSFGVFHGEILHVKLLFSKEISDEVKNYNFHPTQKVKEQKDGSVLVTFKASGSKEIIWHVFKWGKNCKILSPQSLQDDYIRYLKENLNNYNIQ